MSFSPSQAQLAPAKIRRRKRKHEFEDWLKHTDECSSATRQMIGCKAHLAIIASFLQHKEVLRMQAVCKEFQRFVCSHNECFGSSRLPWVKLATKLGMQKFARHPLSKHFGVDWAGPYKGAYPLCDTRAMRLNIFHASHYGLSMSIETLYIDIDSNAALVQNVAQLRRLRVLHLSGVGGSFNSQPLTPWSMPDTLRELLITTGDNIDHISLNADLERLYWFAPSTPSLKHMNKLKVLHLNWQNTGNTHLPASLDELSIENAWQGIVWPPALRCLRWSMKPNTNYSNELLESLSCAQMQQLIDQLPSSLRELVLADCIFTPVNLPLQLTHLTLSFHVYAILAWGDNTDTRNTQGKYCLKCLKLPAGLRSFVLATGTLASCCELPHSLEVFCFVAHLTASPTCVWKLPSACHLFAHPADCSVQYDGTFSRSRETVEHWTELRRINSNLNLHFEAGRIGKSQRHLFVPHAGQFNEPHSSSGMLSQPIAAAFSSHASSEADTNCTRCLNCLLFVR